MDERLKKRRMRPATINLAVFGCALLIGSLYWLSDARGAFGFLPVLLLLACPLMHLLMHRHHGGHARVDQEASGGPPSLSKVRTANDR